MSEPEDWRLGALCREVDPELFWPEKGRSVAEAIRVCMKCDVRLACLEWAVSNKEREGVWGGTTGRTRRDLQRLRRRAA